MSRPDPSPEPASGSSWLGRRLPLLVGAIAQGGHCVARYQGRVLFVRHCLPGESVIAEVTEDRGGSFCRADAVEVLVAAPQRVAPPCEYAHPGGCGGCDFQHVSLDGQRALKAAVVAEQLARLAGIDRDVTVRALATPRGLDQPAAGSLDRDQLADDGLGWRRRIRFAVTPDGALGLRKHRSHRVVPVTHCPLGAPGVGDATALTGRWPELSELEVAADDLGAVAVTGYRQLKPATNRPGRRAQRPQLRAQQLSGPAELHYQVAGREFRLRPTGFWQTHPQAAVTFVETVLAAAELRAGERALDLYAGAGLFTAALAAEVGSHGRVLGLEGDSAAVAAAHGNLADLAWASVARATVTGAAVEAAVAELGRPAAIVLDPPRAGAGAEVLRAVLAARPRVVIYVACDPAALARDLRTAVEQGWELAELSAFDAFPMTHHMECIAVLRDAGPARP